jgi:hypothetical protein
MARYRGRRPIKEVVMIQEIGHVIGSQATGRLATSALPGAPVLPAYQPRHRVARRLLGALTGRGRTRT